MNDLFENREDCHLICIDRPNEFSIVYLNSVNKSARDHHYIITLSNSNLYLYNNCIYINYQNDWKQIFKPVRLNAIINLTDIISVIKSPFNLSLNEEEKDFTNISTNDFVIDYNLSHIKDKMKKLNNYKVFL